MQDSFRTRTVLIAREPIELYQLLKIDNLVASGGEAKAVIAGGHVRVNGVIETRKRKKITRSDIVTYGNENIRIEVGQ